MKSTQHNIISTPLNLPRTVLSRLQPGSNTMFCYLNNTVQQHYVTLLPGGQHFQPTQPLFKVCIFPWAQPLDKFSVVISPLVKRNSLLEVFHFHGSASLWFLSPSAALEPGILLNRKGPFSTPDLNISHLDRKGCQNELYHISYNSESQCKVDVDFTSYNRSPFRCTWVPTSPASVKCNAFEIQC